MDKNTVAFRKALKEVCENKTFANNPQNIHTPYALCEEMIGRLREFVNLKAKTILLLNLEFVEELRYLGFNTETMYFATACKEKAGLLKHSRYNGVKLIFGDYLTLNTTNMKFDVIVGNPPYQNNSGNKGSNNTLWDKFIIKSLEILKDGGFLCFVHPSGWRAIGGQGIGQMLKCRKMIYLEIHNEQDGQQTFGVSSRYDWYVLQNSPNNSPTLIKDQEGIINKYDISKMEFIPNYGLDVISKLITSNENERVEVIKNCAYHSHNFNKGGEIKISREKTRKHKYPCVYSVNRQNQPKFLWSSFNNNGHFGIPKVIFGSGATGFFVDINGDYGQTEFARGVVDAPSNLPKIAKALNSPKFKDIIKIMSVGASEINVEILKCFRKDFWKEFINDDGTEKV